VSPPVSTFQALSLSTVGLRTAYPLVDIGPVVSSFPEHLLPDGLDRFSTAPVFPLTYLDSTASTMMIGPVRKALDFALEHYANTHSRAYPSARISTRAYEKAHETVLRFVGADPTTHTAVFVGHGATGAVNRLARSLFAQLSEPKSLVVVSEMEHHANFLPWVKHAPKTAVFRVDPERGTLCLDALESVLAKNSGYVRLVAVTGVSNVTGIVNDVAAISELAHKYGADLLVDAAQMAPHRAIHMTATGIDYLVFSGHKIYAPGSPGILVMPKESVPAVPDEMGGGIVRAVNREGYVLTTKLPDREEAGTPDILGAAQLSAALETLSGIGMEAVWEHERKLAELLVSGLAVFSEIRIYGDADLKRTPRAGVVSFNIEGLHRTIVSKALADYFSIAVRGGRFCAYPYVTTLLAADSRKGHPQDGMVRASVGIYTTEEDIQRFHHAIDWIIENQDRLRAEYEITADGSAVRRDGWGV
jgi:cysteine desulfurase / selenocysteine lyase